MFGNFFENKKVSKSTPFVFNSLEFGEIKLPSAGNFHQFRQY